MSALVKKEIRLLLPLWIGTLLLVALAACFFPAAIEVRFFAVGVCCIVLAAASYGLEFSYGTFSLLLAQPAPRARIWKVKAGVLVAALLSVACAFAVCQKLAPTGPLKPQQWLELFFLLATSAGAFCAAIVVRQIFAAFWLAWLIAMAVLAFSIFALSHFWTDIDDPTIFVFTPLILYAGLGIWWSRRSYLQAQDVAPAGDRAVTLGWPAFFRSSKAVARARRRNPWPTLAAKELRLQAVPLTATSALFLLQLGIVVLLQIPHNLGRGYWNGIATISYILSLAWFAIPLLVGSAAIADERRLGISDAQCCLPFPRKYTFAAKALVALLIGTLLPAGLFLLLGSTERLQEQFAIPDLPDFDFPLTCLVFASITFAGIFASSLARQTTEAFFIGFCLVFALSGAVAFGFDHEPFAFGYYALGEGTLAGYLLVLAILIGLPGLAWLNFRNSDGTRRKLKSALGLASIVAMPALLSSLVYHRAWEYLLPAPSHGPARISGDGAPKFGGYLELLLSFPDGKLWRGVEDHRTSRLMGQRFVDGANWTKTATDGRTIFAIRSDGSLWSSQMRRASSSSLPWNATVPLWNLESPMRRLGTQSDWVDVISEGWVVYLLKTDGTLWRVRDGRAVPEEIMRLGGEASWTQFLHDGAACACIKNAKGEIWTLWTTNRAEMAARSGNWAATYGDESTLRQFDAETSICRHPLIGGVELDQWRSLRRNYADPENPLWLGIREDGTLWTWKPALVKNHDGRGSELLSPERVGERTDWRSIVGFGSDFLLLAGDGTIWKLYDPAADTTVRLERIDSHSDWVGLSIPVWENLALSADGGLWRWESEGSEYEVFIGLSGVEHFRQLNPSDSPDQPRHSIRFSGIKLAPPRGPIYLGNIFDISN